MGVLEVLLGDREDPGGGKDPPGFKTPVWWGTPLWESSNRGDRSKLPPKKKGERV
jgi:hypothetical protein